MYTTLLSRRATTLVTSYLHLSAGPKTHKKAHTCCRRVGKATVDWVASNQTPRQLKAANIFYTRRCNTTHKYTERFYF